MIMVSGLEAAVVAAAVGAAVGASVAAAAVGASVAGAAVAVPPQAVNAMLARMTNVSNKYSFDFITNLLLLNLRKQVEQKTNESRIA
jgi:hypothetical protein